MWLRSCPLPIGSMVWSRLPPFRLLKCPLARYSDTVCAWCLIGALHIDALCERVNGKTVLFRHYEWSSRQVLYIYTDHLSLYNLWLYQDYVWSYYTEFAQKSSVTSFWASLFSGFLWGNPPVCVPLCSVISSTQELPTYLFGDVIKNPFEFYSDIKF